MMKWLTAGLLALLAMNVAVHATPSDGAANIAVIREHHALLNQGDWRTAATAFSEDTKNFGRVVGRAVILRIFEDIYHTFPDYKMEVLDIASEGDTVIVRCMSSGTHKGIGEIPVNGGLLVGVPPTGKHFQAEVVHYYTLKDGKIVDHRGIRDDLAMMTQLGLIAPPKPFDWAKFAAEANKH